MPFADSKGVAYVAPPRETTRIAALHLRRAELLMGMGQCAQAERALDDAVAAKDSFDMRVSASGLLEKAGRLGGALRHAEAASRFEPLALVSLKAQARIWGRLAQEDLALRFIFKVLELDPADSELRLRAAEMLLQKESYGEAVRQLDIVLREAPGIARGWLIKARLCNVRGEYPRALQAAEKSLGLGERSAATWREKGAALFKLGRGIAAEACWNNAHRLDPGDSETFLWKAEAGWSEGRLEEALSFAEAALAASLDNMPVHLLRALCLLDMGNPAWVTPWRRVAIEALPRGLEGMKDRVSARGHLVRLLARLRGCRTQPSTFVRGSGTRSRLIRMTHPVPGFRQGPRQRAAAVQRLIQLGEPALAWREFDRLLAARMDPVSRALLLCYRGEARLWVGDLDAAESDFLACVALNPRTRWSMVGLCAVRTSQRRLPEALEASDKALAMGARSVRVWRGEALRLSGRLDESRAELELALEENPSRLGALLNLALVEARSGRAEKAKALARRAAEYAGPLFQDAAAVCGSAAFAPEKAGPDCPRVLEKCLEFLRGNRSSWTDVYFNARGEPARFRSGKEP